MALAWPARGQTFYGVKVVTDSSNRYPRAFAVTVDDYTASGAESVAGYYTINRYRDGTAFALVAEVQDVWGTHGGFWGIEIDAMTTGPSPGNRHGLGIVVGRSAGRGAGEAELDNAIWITGFDPGRAKFGIRIDLPTAHALSIPGGNIQFSDDPAVPVYQFDPQTGYIGLWRDGLCILCVHATSGEQRSMWRP